MGEAESKPAAGSVSRELSKDDLLRYVELDLWNRFQDRLWKIVGLVLTGVTVLGLLGVPYYIKSEVSSRIESREKEFAERTKEVLEYSKLLAILKARYDGERYRFDGDVLRLVDALNQMAKPGSDTGPSFIEPAGELSTLLSKSDFSDIVAGSSFASFEAAAAMNDKKVLPPTVMVVSGKGVILETGEIETHPIKNGTYGGAVRDLKFRMVVLEALRNTINRTQEEMLNVGHSLAETNKNGAVTAASLLAKEFLPAFSSEVSSIANSFLKKEEQAVFATYQKLYTLDYQTNYAPAPAPAQPKADAGR
jgi:hypothetical protein